MKNHAIDIIEDTLSISYEPEEDWKSETGEDNQIIPPLAVLLITRCCPTNHDHMYLRKEQAKALAEWLTAFVDGKYEETK